MDMNVKEVYVLFIFRNVSGAFTSSGGKVNNQPFLAIPFIHLIYSKHSA